MAFARTHALVMTAPDDPAFENNPSDWNEDHSVSGADVGGIPYCPTATTETTSANLTYAETSGPRLQVGSSGTSTGVILGYAAASGEGGLWASTDTIANNTARILVNAASTQINVPSTGSAGLFLRIGQVTRLQIPMTVGAGALITAGTATTDVQALSATQTWNASGVTFTGWKFTITDTASAAGSLAMQILGGASGTTSLFKVTKGGKVDAPAYAANGTDGADFGPGLPTSITVVKGIITAIS